MIQQNAKSTWEDRPTIEMFEVTDPVELAAARKQTEEFERNSQWLQEHISEVYAPCNRGKVVCIAGREAFFGDSVQEAVSRAKTAHPDDTGRFSRYIPKQKMTMIYAT
jgi:hypothetical protein